jgi:acyl carrier protein
METMAISKSVIESSVKKIISEKLGIQESQISDSASFQSDLGIDSLDLYEVIMVIEKEFDLKIPDEEAEKLTSVGKLIDYLSNKK